MQCGGHTLEHRASYSYAARQLLPSYVCLVSCPVFPHQFARIQLLPLESLLQIRYIWAIRFPKWLEFSLLNLVKSTRGGNPSDGWRPIHQTWQLVRVWSCGWQRGLCIPKHHGYDGGEHRPGNQKPCIFIVCALLCRSA